MTEMSDYNRACNQCVMVARRGATAIATHQYQRCTNTNDKRVSTRGSSPMNHEGSRNSGREGPPKTSHLNSTPGGQTPCVHLADFGLRLLPPSQTGAPTHLQSTFTEMNASSVLVPTLKALVKLCILPFGMSLREQFSIGVVQQELQLLQTPATCTMMHLNPNN